MGVLDSLPEIGGQVSAMYPEKLIYDIAGFPAVRGRDLIARLAEQAAAYAPRYILGEEACFLDDAGGRRSSPPRPGCGCAPGSSS